MCGIVGVASKTRQFQREWLAKVRDMMARRGSDDAGECWSADGRVGLAQRRLSTIQLSALGHQPMHLAGRELTIVSLIFSYSIFGAIIYFYFLTFPIVKYMTGRINKLVKIKYSLEVVALLVAIITLWHLSSLLQTSNIMIFMVIYASCLNGMNRTK